MGLAHETSLKVAVIVLTELKITLLTRRIAVTLGHFLDFDIAFWFACDHHSSFTSYKAVARGRRLSPDRK